MNPGNLIRVPLVRQSTNFTCGVAALQSVLAYYSIFHREDKLAENLCASPTEGTPNWEIVRFAKSVGLEAESKTHLAIADLEGEIEKGNPVIVALQAWKSKEDHTDWKDLWDHGHYIVTIGFDERNLYFMDPSTLANYTYIPKSEFLDRWHDIDQNDEKVINLGIIISNPNNLKLNDSTQFVPIK